MTTTNSTAVQALTACAAGGDAEAADTLAAALAEVPPPGTPPFLRLLARAGRSGRGVPAGEDAARLRALGIAAPERWPPGRAARAAVVVAAAVVAGAEAPARLTAALRTSDTEERAAILQALVLLPEPGRFAALAADACRSSVQTVFEAVACDNRFPAAHFADPVFNQMVLKAVFTGAPLARVAGLADRVTPELRRMAADFRAERLAAGRPVPPDLDVLLAFEPGNPTR